MKINLLIVLFSLVVTTLFGQQYKTQFVQMEDGVNLAVDIYFPSDYKEGQLPTLIQFERYWRSSIDKKSDGDPTLYGLSKFFNDNGYIIVVVDTRGSGASFGTRRSEYSPEEVHDAKQVLDWLVTQPWSDGNVGSYGTSYTGTTAELLCATEHPALKAVIPGWSDFDIYRSPVRPYGLLASGFIRKWGFYVKMLDRNRSMIIGNSIRPVNEDSLKPALKDHKNNLDVYRTTKNGQFRDSQMGAFGYDECSVVHWEKEIERSDVPMFVLASWMDAGTAEGTIQRLEHFDNPQKVLLMATSHGGWSNASPFSVSDQLMYPNPMVAVQNQLQLDFFDHYVKGIDKGVDEWPLLRYFNMGEEKYKESNTWPIKGTEYRNFYFQEEGGLNTNAPTTESGSDKYKVDFGIYTSENNRWTTQMEGPVTELNDRNEMDERMLVYTSKPMEEDVQITGTPKLNIQMSSTHEDGAVFVYLEDVDENGKSTYITEGGIRLIHRKIADESENPYNLHSFNEEDAAPMTPGKIENVSLKMWPTSVLVKKGHSIRVAIGGADKSTFDRVPKRGRPTYEIFRSDANQSFITLPVVGE